MHPSIERRKGSPQARDFLQWKSNLIANLIVVTYCNRACPHCCEADMTLRSPPRDVPLKQIAHDIYALGPVGAVLLTGGEATLHKDFVAMLETARKARGPATLVLYTNGAKLLEHASDITRLCDRVNMSVYDNTSNAGEPTDPTIVEKFSALCPSNVHFDHFQMTGSNRHQEISGGSNPCFRLFNTISAQEGRVYPCSVAHGITDAESTELSRGWEMRLLDVVTPCERCVFGEK
jgi:uncharacterized radical SAM superfamily Fe-S cluster-containing enzyme